MADREKFSYIRLNDYDWLRQSFMISHDTAISSEGGASEEDQRLRARFFTTAEFKFSDTRVGGNMVINPAPQFTRNADPRIKGLYKNGTGLGRYYSDVLDENKRVITMTFGLPQFNSLSQFYRGFYNHTAATVARTGRSPGIFYRVGQVLGFVAGFLSPWLVLYSLGSAFVRIALQQSSSKYYFFKPAMPTYWNAVSGIANDLAVKTQLISRSIGQPVGTGGDVRSTALTDDELNEVNRHLLTESVLDSPKESGESNGLNVYAIATRYQRMQRSAFKALEKAYETRSIGEYADTINEEGKHAMQIVSASLTGSLVKVPKRNFQTYLNEWTADNAPGSVSVNKSAGSPEKSMSLSMDDTQAELAAENGTNADGTLKTAVVPEGSRDLLTETSIGQGSESEQNSWVDFLTAELDDGAQYVAFRVENGGDQSESFSNQVGESEISSKINSLSASSRATRFSFADGNLEGGMIGKAMSGIVNSAKDLAMGAANTLGVDGLAALGGNAFADIPKTWFQSTTDMPGMNYRMKLVSPYGNRYSKFVNLWLPFSMILAGALPLSAGPHAYTSPLLCQVFDRGRAQTRLGMITSLSVTRGGMNLAWNRAGEPMAIEVSFTVTELSNILHMPLAQGFNPLDIGQIFDNESLYHDYMAVLSSLSLAEQIYFGERLKLGLTKYTKNLDSWFSVPHAVNWAADMAPLRVFSALFDGVANR